MLFYPLAFVNGQASNPISDTIYSIVDEPARPSSKTYDTWQRGLIKKLPKVEYKVINEWASCWRVIEFVVEQNGSLTFIKAPKCANEDIREAMKKMIESEEPFIPAKNRGVIVRQRMYISFSCIKLN